MNFLLTQEPQKAHSLHLWYIKYAQDGKQVHKRMLISQWNHLYRMCFTFIRLKIFPGTTFKNKSFVSLHAETIGRHLFSE